MCFGGGAELRCVVFLKNFFFLLKSHSTHYGNGLYCGSPDIWLEYFGFLAKPYRTLRSDGEGPRVTVSEGRVALVLSAWPRGLCSSEAHTM